MQQERLRKGDLSILKLRIAPLEDRDEVVPQGLRRMVLIKGAQRGAVTRPDSQAAPARAFMMAAIAMLEEKAYGTEGREVIVQAERIDVMTQNAFISVRRFGEWVTPVLFPEAVPVEIRNHQPIDESEQCRLVEEHSALLDRNGKAQRAVGIAMLIVGHDPAAYFLDLRQRIWKAVRDYQFDFERFRDRFQPVGGRLERQRAGNDCFGIVFDNVCESFVNARQFDDLLPQVFLHTFLHGFAGLVI